nr:immunoglobulin heavy chain junction region [Macaca mulatta]MOV54268.1 immunoglobulin heavy chain junction region [Macaca mulatta]MOV55391.1 immunoglobulin heavy chain junction region [Macaca mulatta]MOV56750.1 immunoglobulin heavy chain junction region [Macaca mulatta]MOV57107.1 immunoglobulin heavy chain junction region [Macaca mulatta]
CAKDREYCTNFYCKITVIDYW